MRYWHLCRPFACFLLYSYCLFCQDDTAFEKQSALFALAVSDIVLINMWVCFSGYFEKLQFMSWNLLLLALLFVTVNLFLFCSTGFFPCNICEGGVMILAESKLQISLYWKLSFRYHLVYLLKCRPYLDIRKFDFI